jgi:hypothetical protein
MKKAIIATVFMAALACICTGCGHNVLTYSSGQYLNIGVDPNTQKMGVQYINGDLITAVEKDNAVLTVELKDGLDADGKKTTKVSKIIYEIKEQITGSDVEMEMVKRE